MCVRFIISFWLHKNCFSEKLILLKYWSGRILFSIKIQFRKFFNQRGFSSEKLQFSLFFDYTITTSWWKINFSMRKLSTEVFHNKSFKKFQFKIQKRKILIWKISIDVLSRRNTTICWLLSNWKFQRNFLFFPSSEIKFPEGNFLLQWCSKSLIPFCFFQLSN